MRYRELLVLEHLSIGSEYRIFTILGETLCASIQQYRRMFNLSDCGFFLIWTGSPISPASTSSESDSKSFAESVIFSPKDSGAYTVNLLLGFCLSDSNKARNAGLGCNPTMEWEAIISM